ncbi:MAG: altronate dehydratase [Armatimonadetes bacterium]|nr:altronate dehydratase [Armatimonadota bacterium]
MKNDTRHRVALEDVSLLLKPADDVAVVIAALDAGVEVVIGTTTCVLKQCIPVGHKISVREIQKDKPVRKYGQVIGFATERISAGCHIHTHNLRIGDYVRDHAVCSETRPTEYFPDSAMRHFDGFQRDDGRVGTRNYVAVLSTVNCSASIARRIAQRFTPEKLAEFPNVDGVIAIAHGRGCAMSREEEQFEMLRRVLYGYSRHPNVGGCLLLGLGCEAVHPTNLIDKNELLPGDPHGIVPVTLEIQETGGTAKTIQAGVDIVDDLLRRANGSRRTRQPVSELVLGTQCGGSDAYSGITANPALGVAADLLVRYGGTSVLGETPEIYGAEHLLTRRARSPEVAEKLLDRIRWWEEYVGRCGSSINNNPSPGNKAGGLTTIFEKSLGAIAKGGTETLSGVYQYGERVTQRGFVILDTPGYDPVSVTGLVASGCNIVVFTTGRGSVFGCKPVPSIKVATNSQMYRHMTDDMDVDAGVVLDESSVEEVGEQIFEEMIAVASGKMTKSERHGFGEDEFVPWILGPTL